MAAYYTSQAFDAPPTLIWSILTDFTSWPEWFPHVDGVAIEGGTTPGRGAVLRATGVDPAAWTRWEIVSLEPPTLLACEHLESTTPGAPGIAAARLQFELIEEPEGCTLEVEIGAEGYGVVGNLFVGMTLGPGARRLLPQLMDSFTAYVVERVAGRT
jgi:uncharacterized protein YndB with AHSA1/START domain